MYEDDKLWPIKCSECSKEFEKPVGWLKANDAVHCPICGLRQKYTHEEFGLALAKAQGGTFDPYGNMVWVNKRP